MVAIQPASPRALLTTWTKVQPGDLAFGDVSRHDKNALALIRHQKIGFVFQGFNLLARTTALENTELPTLYTKIDKAEREKRASEALVGLAERAHHYPSQSGEQQRMAIARASVNRPSILPAAEPTGNLDSRTSVEIIETSSEFE